MHSRARLGDRWRGHGPRRTVAPVSVLSITLLALSHAAAGPRVRLERSASTVAIQFEDMMMAVVVTELGTHFSFKVVDLAAAGPRSSRTLRAVSVVGLLGQLLSADGYAVTYRRDGGGSQVLDKIVLLSASRMRGHTDGPRPPGVDRG